MATRRTSEAERFRQHNDEMKLALAENCTVLEARKRLAVRQWREFEARMERLRVCGTAANHEQSAEADRFDLPLAYGGPPSRVPYWWERD